MGVNLSKQNKQGDKVSLQKEGSNKRTNDEKKMPFLWIGIPIAVAAVILIVGLSIRNGGDEAADELIEDWGNQEEVGKINEADREETPAVSGAAERIDDASLHRYEVIAADVTWSEAFADCISRGGYLCRINSAEENEKIKELLNNQNARGVVYLGGMREEDSNQYHWIDSDRNPLDDVINDGVFRQFWHDKEPSYVDYVNGEEITEKYMALIYISSMGEWYWNDVSDDVFSLSPSFFSGKLYYICEYE